MSAGSSSKIVVLPIIFDGDSFDFETVDDNFVEITLIKGIYISCMIFVQ